MDNYQRPGSFTGPRRYHQEPGSFPRSMGYNQDPSLYTGSVNNPREPNIGTAYQQQPESNPYTGIPSPDQMNNHQKPGRCARSRAYHQEPGSIPRSMGYNQEPGFYTWSINPQEPNLGTAYQQQPESYPYTKTPSSGIAPSLPCPPAPKKQRHSYFLPINSSVLMNQPATSSVPMNLPSTSSAAPINQPSTSFMLMNQPSTSFVLMNQPSTSSVLMNQPSTSSAPMNQLSTSSVPISQPSNSCRRCSRAILEWRRLFKENDELKEACYSLRSRISKLEETIGIVQKIMELPPSSTGEQERNDKLERLANELKKTKKKLKRQSREGEIFKRKYYKFLKRRCL